MKYTIVTAFDEEEKDYIAEIKELDEFGSGKTEFEAVENATRIILGNIKVKS
jgi:predicted RNase H-like HicB family nuclease